MYQALYRKWRPQRFDDVVGQQHITETLKRQIAAGRLSHAYIFVGTRGTGKTTCAKILAKAANCEHPVDGNPCNVCASCRGIDSGAILDVEELDAASNNSVDNIRALRDEAVFTPASVRKRVYIVDEVHMLSGSAFNALLKILEEPPEHLIFILATTELRKVPATILSRCQRFSFKRIAPEDIKTRLLYVSGQEKIDLTGEAADILSRLADGSMRDALSLLDQCAGDGTVDAEKVNSTIGLAGSGEAAKLLDAALASDSSAALEIFDRLYFDGKDAASILKELAALIRDILLKEIAPKSASKLSSGSYTADVIEHFSAATAPGRLLAGLETLQKALADMAQSADRRTAAELCLITLCIGSPAPFTAPVQSAPARSPAPASAEAVGRRPPDKAADAEIAPAPAVEAKEKAPEAVLAPAPVPAGPDVWQSIVKALADKLSPANYSFISDKTHSSGYIREGQLEIRARTPFASSMIDLPHVTDAIREAAAGILGRPVAVKVTVGEPDTEIKDDKLDSLMKFGNVTIK